MPANCCCTSSRNFRKTVIFGTFGLTVARFKYAWRPASRVLSSHNRDKSKIGDVSVFLNVHGFKEDENLNLRLITRLNPPASNRISPLNIKQASA